MRLRNIPRAESVLANSEMVIKDERHFVANGTAKFFTIIIHFILKSVWEKVSLF